MKVDVARINVTLLFAAEGISKPFLFIIIFILHLVVCCRKKAERPDVTWSLQSSVLSKSRKPTDIERLWKM